MSKVTSTTDYDQFKFIGANRETSRGHIETLKVAFLEVGNLTEIQPLVVNEHKYIIDGQHRFEACKELAMPVFYREVEGLTVNDARQMNILHRNWTTDDFAHSYADTGNKHYIDYLRIKEEYEFPHSVILLATRLDTTGVYGDFRKGLFEFEDLEQATDFLDKLDEIREVLPVKLTRDFARAFIRMFHNDQYDQKRMVSKLKKHPELIHPIAGQADGMRLLEEVYNFKIHDANRVRLF